MKNALLLVGHWFGLVLPMMVSKALPLNAYLPTKVRVQGLGLCCACEEGRLVAVVTSRGNEIDNIENREACSGLLLC